MLRTKYSIIVVAFCVTTGLAQCTLSDDEFDYESFMDSARHWYAINDETPKLVTPSDDQKKYSTDEIRNIADNILLYQRSNGGWNKNYDMMAVLTEEQKKTLIETKNNISLTTFDNGATHSQVEFLAVAYSKTGDERYKSAAIQGVDFILSAQYPNGGFPQFFPDTSGYRKHITFNDGAMLGVMKVLSNIANNQSWYSFIDDERRKKVRTAYDKGLECIVRSQIRVRDSLTAWCQQHDHIDLSPQPARKFEPKAITNMESADIVLFLMKVKNPSQGIIDAVQGAVAWFERSKIYGIRVETIKAPPTQFIYHSSDEDVIVVPDKNAPPLWTRMYEIDTGRPMFCNRDGKPVYTLAEVERERRTGYKWYVDEPEEVLNKYPQWLQKVNKIKK